MSAEIDQCIHAPHWQFQEDELRQESLVLDTFIAFFRDGQKCKQYIKKAFTLNCYVYVYILTFKAFF